MDSSRVYNEESRQQTVDSMKGKKKNSRYTTYCLLSTEKGIALIMVLVISAILLAIMAGLIYMITSGTQISGMQKRYKTALEAGIGGSDVTYQLIGARGNPNIQNIYFNFSPDFTSSCMTAKLNTTISLTNWASCSNYSKTTSLSIDPIDTATYDLSFDLGISPTYRVYSKIVNTVEGNSGGDEGLLKSGVVSANSGEVTVKSIPYLYTIEVDAENTSQPVGNRERAKLSILYQY